VQGTGGSDEEGLISKVTDLETLVSKLDNTVATLKSWYDGLDTIDITYVTSVTATKENGVVTDISYDTASYYDLVRD
jgi:hypothetical protein